LGSCRDGDILVKEGLPTVKMYMVLEGEVEREKVFEHQIHKVDLETTHSKSTFGALHLLKVCRAYVERSGNPMVPITLALHLAADICLVVGGDSWSFDFAFNAHLIVF
jgi:hypothetical protein